MLGREAQLYAIARDGALNQYPKVEVVNEKDMPSGGALSNPNDKAVVQQLEDKMIEAYGKGMVVHKCKAGGEVNLQSKMLRAVHVNALAQAADENSVTELNLWGNQLGVEGAARLAEALQSGKLKTVTTLR